MNEQDKGVTPSGPGHEASPSAADASSQSRVPNAVIAPLPEPRRVAAIARIATANLDGLVGPPAWGAAEVAARHGYGYGWYACLPVALEYAARLAEERFTDPGWNDFLKIAGHNIASDLRRAASAMSAGTAETPQEAQGQRPASATAESGDAQPHPGDLP
jgi:hypothetical protein